MFRFRFVYYMPDPFIECRIPIGVEVEVGAEVTRIPVEKVPDESYLGGPGAACLRMYRADFLRSRENPGPHQTEADWTNVPAGADDPIAWVRSFLARSFCGIADPCGLSSQKG